MDDFLSGTETLEAAIKLRDGLVEVLSSAGLELRKWKSNKDNLIADLSVDTNDSKIIHTCEINNDTITKILGLSWRSNTLQFEVHEKYIQDSDKITKL